MSDSGSDSADFLSPSLNEIMRGVKVINWSLKSIDDYLFPKKKTKKLVLTSTDCVAIIFFMALGMFTRFFRIHFPATVVFDEVHFGNFTNWYLKGEYFHDIHPPLAKLIMAGVAKYADYKADLNFAGIKATEKYPNMIYVSLRSTPAFFGALCVPLSYIAMRAMNCNPMASCMAALMVASDLVLVIEARHILSDGILHAFSCLAILMIFMYERYPNFWCLIIEGISLGCVAACKYTSGGIVLLALIRQFDLRVLFKNRKDTIAAMIRCAILCFLVAFIHIVCFWIHLEVLPYQPENPVHMPDCVRAGLMDKKHPNYAARRSAPPMLYRILTLMVYMHQGNMKITGEHPYGSKWWSWPLALRKWVLYWTNEGKHIICMSNVLLWYPVFFGVCANLVRAVIEWDWQSEETAALFGWILSYLPFALIPREMFLYHYAIPLIFGIYNLNLLIERHTSPKVRGFCLFLFTSMAIFGFFKWCPWVYGLTTPDFDFLVWNNNWR